MSAVKRNQHKAQAQAQATEDQNMDTTQTKTKEVRTIPEGIADMPTKSAKIRALSAEGWSRSEIANALNIRYQHVRNVLVTPLAKDKK